VRIQLARASRECPTVKIDLARNAREFPNAEVRQPLAGNLRFWHTELMSDLAIDIEKLTRDQRLELLERLWESLHRDPAGVPLTDSQIVELDRRLDRIEREGPDGVAWEDVLREMESTEP
jgi:putative addiction module component (TIGR02574 family)